MRKVVITPLSNNSENPYLPIQALQQKNADRKQIACLCLLGDYKYRAAHPGVVGLTFSIADFSSNSCIVCSRNVACSCE